MLVLTTTLQIKKLKKGKTVERNSPSTTAEDVDAIKIFFLFNYLCLGSNLKSLGKRIYNYTTNKERNLSLSMFSFTTTETTVCVVSMQR